MQPTPPPDPGNAPPEQWTELLTEAERQDIEEFFIKLVDTDDL